MPFVQGHLRNEPVGIRFETECGHCARPLHIDVDADLRHRVHEATDPLIFVPRVDFEKLKAPSIIDPF